MQKYEVKFVKFKATQRNPSHVEAIYGSEDAIVVEDFSK